MLRTQQHASCIKVRKLVAKKSQALAKSCASVSRSRDLFLLVVNRQLAKLLSGNEVRARSRSRLCGRLSTSLVRGLEKFLERRFIPTRRSFNPHDLPAYLLRVQDPFFGGKKADLFDRKLRYIDRNGDAVDGVACLVVVR